MIDAWLPSTLFVLSAVFVLVAVLYGFHPLKRWQLRRIPGPTPQWYAGNLLEIMRQSSYHYYIRNARKYGKVFKVWFGATPVIVVTDPDLGRAVNLRNPNRHTAMGPVAVMSPKDRIFDSEGILLTKDRAYHRSLRNAWQPAFFSESLNGYANLMNSGADRLIKRLGKAAAKGQEVNIWRMLGDLTMDVVGTASFGVEFKTQEDDDEDPASSKDSRELVMAAQTIFQMGGAGGSLYVPIVVLCPALLPLVRLVAGAFPDARIKTLVKARTKLQQTCLKLLQQARERIAAEASGKAAKPERGLAPGSFMQHMAIAKHHAGVKNGSPFTDTEIVQQEVDAFGRDRVAQNSDLEGLPYVQAVFKEALRLFPPGHLSIREAVEDLNLNGFLVEKGSWVHVSLCGIHRDPDVWDKPDEFVPERWVPGAPEEATEAQKRAWMPFGDGIRACVGKRFAWEEALIALLRIYQRFEFKLSPGQVPLEVRSPFTLGPAKGIFVTPILRGEE
ncbi:cytochrome P450 [Coccomyxa subellipsoidea C-169]|uniref:Cytochrome P450 n=1 Tax=Coccomyxa subellipsoidea (strain C-169) TaxID=574566 RepID=I0YQX5_COCSC|nr:cytochrome P450 [Coccomyxa subellipsoidea C-169]EIE20794.1 cytochrome P450 [Coccomyxa subellipsoidea C-169]|eukprot:XP_005645338.1 cytochrome P450 [Coccomyxa subellipsoidea C-169]